MKSQAFKKLSENDNKNENNSNPMIYVSIDEVWH